VSRGVYQEYVCQKALHLNKYFLFDTTLKRGYFLEIKYTIEEHGRRIWRRAWQGA
jgi:hypothetical protein